MNVTSCYLDFHSLIVSVCWTACCQEVHLLFQLLQQPQEGVKDMPELFPSSVSTTWQMWLSTINMQHVTKH